MALKLQMELQMELKQQDMMRPSRPSRWWSSVRCLLQLVQWVVTVMSHQICLQKPCHSVPPWTHDIRNACFSCSCLLLRCVSDLCASRADHADPGIAVSVCSSVVFCFCFRRPCTLPKQLA